MAIDQSELRRAHFAAVMAARKLLEFDKAIAQMELMLGHLSAYVLAEERRAGITDVNHCKYPLSAKSAAERSRCLRSSIANMRNERAHTHREYERMRQSSTTGALRRSAPQ
jgi:hypothetical protein